MGKPVQVKITEMFAFVAHDEKGEGIVGMLMPDGSWMPLVGADMARVEALKKSAQLIANASGKNIKILKFSNMEQIGELKKRAELIHG